jgi:hypothetical protein
MAPQMAPALSSVGTTFDNSSSYTLRPVATGSTQDPRSPLISPATPTYGTTPARLEGAHPPRPSRRPLLIALLKMTLLFLTSSALLGGTLWLALPTLEEYVHITYFNYDIYMLSSETIDLSFEFQSRSPSYRH